MHTTEPGDTAPISYDELIRRIERLLTGAGIESAAAEARTIVAHAAAEPVSRIDVLRVLGTEALAETAERALRIADERAQRVPLQHLTGTAPFRRIELDVGPGVFIPRPETEVLAGAGLSTLPADREATVLDLCTGSGAIALALVDEHPLATVWAVERDPNAHAWAARNVARLGQGRVTLLLGDVTDLAHLERGDCGDGGELSELADLRGRVDLLISNPPYVPLEALPRDPEVRDHDPSDALYSGDDGLDMIRILSRIGEQYVAIGGSIMFEHTEEQGDAVRKILERGPWERITTNPDLTGRDRYTRAERAPAEDRR